MIDMMNYNKKTVSELIDKLDKKYEFFLPNTWTVEDIALNIVGEVNNHEKGYAKRCASLIEDTPKKYIPGVVNHIVDYIIRNTQEGRNECVRSGATALKLIIHLKLSK